MPRRVSGWLLAAAALPTLASCAEPKRPAPADPTEVMRGDGKCHPERRRRVRGAVGGGSSRRDHPDDPEASGYGYELADDPLCAAGGIMGAPAGSSKPPPATEE